MAKFEALNLDDLESVAGGVNYQDRMSPEERARLKELGLRASQADEDVIDGKISEDERDRMYFEWQLYSEELMRKYS